MKRYFEMLIVTEKQNKSLIEKNLPQKHKNELQKYLKFLKSNEILYGEKTNKNEKKLNFPVPTSKSETIQKKMKRKLC